MKTIDEFCGQENGYSRSITLRNKLIPIGKTEEKIKEYKLLDNDFSRAKAYPELKKLIDDFHRSFIEDILKNVHLDWNKLADLITSFQKSSKEDKDSIKTELEKEQAILRKKIVKLFTNDERYKKLFSKELFSDILPEIIKTDESGTISDKESALNIFKGFTTYFVGFHENRKNLYSEEDKSTAISYRIVNENFPKFLANVKNFEYLQDKYPDIISKTNDNLSEYLNGICLNELFCIQGFNKTLSQKGITFYNTVIAGIAGEAGFEKVQGFNEIINLAQQQLLTDEKKNLRNKMIPLYKQILSDIEKISFIPAGFENNTEVYDSVKILHEKISKNTTKDIKNLFSHMNYNLEKIYVPAKSLTAFSQSVCGSWSILPEGFYLLAKGEKNISEKKEEDLRKKVEKKDYSFAELQQAYDKWADFNRLEIENRILIKSYFDLNKVKIISSNDNDKIEKFISFIDSLEINFNKINFEEMKDLQQDKEAAIPIKDYLDSVQNLYHYLKLVDYRGEEIKDDDFYGEIQEILESLSSIIILYNKVRNFVTKKKSDVKKIKLNFDSPTLASGWDENKELQNNAILLMKDNNYYVGIYNPKNKTKQLSVLNSNTSSGCYKKMVYKLLPGPNKMLPKVFFSKKGRAEYNPPEDILKNYELGKHKKGDFFDLKFCHELIDWFKDSINRHPDWKKFDFKFSTTSSYEDIGSFYREVESQGYKITYADVSESTINTMVDLGQLFLFQIYNKDFAKNTTGNKNMHTLYFESLFSEENLRNIVFKLNGEAELFFRPETPNMKIITHEKGSVLVNRTTTELKTIPEELYQEIYNYKNKKIETISTDAKELLDSGTVVCKEATHEIVKDKHFTQDTYLFHCPITINFKAPEITGRKFNERVMALLKSNPNINIIGLDRGERHLIYLTLVNQKGEIIMQKTLNFVDQVRKDGTIPIDYQEKLVQKEGDRDKSRKNWQTIGNIKELKEGYLSNIIHEIAKLMIKYNAIVVMEDLNFGFKRGRFAVERQVYQKFENMLIEKLNYLVFKDKDALEPGGVLNGYQLTDKATTVSDVGKQSGWLFYIPAAYTSKIDPKTGFSNLFSLKGLTNKEKKKEFFDKFTSIRFDLIEQCFVFGFDYNIFDNADYKKKWEIYTREERLIYRPKLKKIETVNPTEDLKKAFDSVSINWNTGDNFIDSLHTIESTMENVPFYDALYRAFSATLQMRNSIPNTEIDYLISPVKASDGTFFDSREELKLGDAATLPKDSDANGAYHIALKGLYLLKNNFNVNDKGYIQGITNADWFKFVQQKEYLK